jgi:DNA-binding NtrC family response regulator
MEKAKVFVTYPEGMEDAGNTLALVLQQSTEIALDVTQLHCDPCAQQFQLATAGFDGSRPDLVFLGIFSGNAESAQDLIRSFVGTPIIAVIDPANPPDVISLLGCGISDFIAPPFRPIDVIPRALRLIRQSRDEEPVVQSLKAKLGLKQLIGESEAFLSEVKKIPLVASCDATVLILGATGTGKELFARAIHYLSTRHGKPFIPVNCGAMPVELIENELFGHVKGAFTSANSTEAGLVNEGEGGTLFLDEIDSLPPAAQAKLLRFLQSKEYRQLGSRKTLLADVRVVAASNSDLHCLIQEGKFRADLFYRLNVLPLRLPPLRDRVKDIRLLANHFLQKHTQQFNRPPKRFLPDAMHILLTHTWPGNVRELESVVERAVIFSQGPYVQPSDIIIEDRPSTVPTLSSFKTAKAKAVEQFEKHYLQELLRANQGNITKAARQAEKNRRAFWELIRKHEIDLGNLGTP